MDPSFKLFFLAKKATLYFPGAAMGIGCIFLHDTLVESEIFFQTSDLRTHLVH